MSNLKSIIGIIATFLVFVGYIPYIKDILANKTKPHLYSWFLWGFVTLLVFALQASGGAGSGSFVTLAAGVMCLVVLALGIVRKNRIKVVFIDTVFLMLALVALGLWLVAKQAILSAMLLTLIDVFAFIPTVRKSWNKPFTETLSFYYLNTLRFVLAVFSLQHYSIVTALYPATWLVANGLFAVLLLVRRKQVPK